jgi:hypothetical protein
MELHRKTISNSASVWLLITDYLDLPGLGEGGA